jgi:hypothetical protein
MAAVALIMWLGLAVGAANATVMKIDSWSKGGKGLSASFGSIVKTSFEDSVHFLVPDVSFGHKSSSFVSLKYDSGVSLDKFELWGDGKLVTSGIKASSDSHMSFSGDSKVRDYELRFKGFSHSGDGSYCGEIVVSPVPEPQTYAMLLIGLGLVGFSARRRKNDTVD